MWLPLNMLSDALQFKQPSMWWHVVRKENH